MKKCVIIFCSLFLFGVTGNNLFAAEINDEAENTAHMNWLEHVSENYDLNWEENNSFPVAEECITDDFEDGLLEPLWTSNAASGASAIEEDGVLKIFGVAPGYLKGAVVRLQDFHPIKSFTAEMDVLAKSGTGSYSTYKGRTYTFQAVGDNGHYFALQYWATGYRISWNNGNGWQRSYSYQNGDEMTTWYKWNLDYDADTKKAKVFVDSRQIGVAATVDLGSSFRVQYHVVAAQGAWFEGHWDNFNLCFAAEDTSPPEITLDSVDPQVLWPPNGKMVDVNVAGSAVDNGSGVASVIIEAEDEYGQVSASRSGFGPLKLEASRDGADSDGRSYLISITATDNVGNKSVKRTQVVVPHDVGLH